MKNAASKIVDKLPKLKVAFGSLTKKELLVGVPHDDVTRKLEPGEHGEMNNATLAYLFEHGSPAANIPARPAIQIGILAGKDKIVGFLKKAAQSVVSLDEKEPGIEKGFVKAGLTAQASIRNAIVAGVPPPLATSTLAARRRRGRTGTTPLLDTAQYRNSINYVIRDKNK